MTAANRLFPRWQHNPAAGVPIGNAGELVDILEKKRAVNRPAFHFFSKTQAIAPALAPEKIREGVAKLAALIRAMT
jgi:hypothetical protein